MSRTVYEAPRPEAAPGETVVTSTCGGLRSMAARSACVVSPVRTATVMRGASMPIASATRRMPRRGSARFL